MCFSFFILSVIRFITINIFNSKVDEKFRINFVLQRLINFIVESSDIVSTQWRAKFWRNVVHTHVWYYLLKMCRYGGTISVNSPRIVIFYARAGKSLGELRKTRKKSTLRDTERKRFRQVWCGQIQVRMYLVLNGRSRRKVQQGQKRRASLVQLSVRCT